MGKAAEGPSRNSDESKRARQGEAQHRQTRIAEGQGRHGTKLVPKSSGVRTVVGSWLNDPRPGLAQRGRTFRLRGL